MRLLPHLALATCLTLSFPTHHHFTAVAAGLRSASTLASPPANFTPNMDAGPGLKAGARYRDSAHFRLVAVTNDTAADGALRDLEAAYACFVDGLGWRSSGLSYKTRPMGSSSSSGGGGGGGTDGGDENSFASSGGDATGASESGPWYKVNVYRVDDIPGAAANTGLDQKTGLSFLNVVTKYLTEPGVTVHEFGHALTYAERYWIDQGRTGAWWETVANFVADTYQTSPVCEAARQKFGRKAGDSLVDLKKVVGDAHQVIVDGSKGSGNYYQAFPFLSYLFNNPDRVPGLGNSVFPAVWNRYKRGSNETPLHVLGRILSTAVVAAASRERRTIQDVVGMYWARMAYVDIGHAKAQQMFFGGVRKTVNYANLDALPAAGRYRVKAARQPRYMGANIVPLKATAGGGGGAVSVAVTAAAGSAAFLATLAIRSPTGGGSGAYGTVRYVALANGTGQASLASGEEASLVVANTPGQLYLYDPFALSSDVSKGLDYEVQLVGAAVA